MKKSIICIVLVFTAICCETDLSPNADFPSIPVVYAIFNESDSVHTVRLTRSFQTDHSIFSNSMPADSMYYPDARVRLELWYLGHFIRDVQFDPVPGLPRDEGVFPQAPVPVYQFRSVSQFGNSFYLSGRTGRLIIEIPGKPVVYSQFQLVWPLQLISPRTEGHTFNMNDFKIYFKSYSPYTEMFVRLHYLNRYADSTTSETVDWREFSDHDLAADNVGKDYTVPLNGNPLYYRIGKIIRDDDKVINRSLEYCELLFNCLDENVYQYNQSLLALPSDQAGRPFTNVVNGMGIVGSRNTCRLTFMFDRASISQLCEGEFTKHLRFVDW